MKKPLLLFAFLFVVVGCTTLGPPYSPPPPPPQGKALVYFMRTSVGYGNFWSTVFSLNDTKIVSLYDKGYSWIHLDEGVYKVAAGTVLNSDYLKFVMPVESGKEYYVEYHQESVGYQRYRNVIRAVDPMIGKGIVSNYSYQQVDAVEIPKQAKEKN